MNKQDVLAILENLCVPVRNTETYYAAETFVQFHFPGEGEGRVELEYSTLYLWSGTGEHYDYAASFKLKSVEHLSDILKVLMGDK